MQQLHSGIAGQAIAPCDSRPCEEKKAMTMEETNSVPVRTLFSTTIYALDELIQKSPRKRREPLTRAKNAIEAVLSDVSETDAVTMQNNASRQLHLASGIVEPPNTDHTALKEWGADLVRRREAAGFSRDVLAKRAGISESTLRNVETGRRAPTRTTIMHLQSVAELRIDASPIIQHATDRRRVSPGFSPNCWLAPEYDAIRLHRELTMQLNGHGGHIEQTYLYFDHASATAWCAFAEQGVYRAARSLMPLSQVSEKIVEVVGQLGLDVIGLGCGDGQDEVRLCEHLLSIHRNDNLRLYLLDISQPLCTGAYRHAAEVLGNRPSVSVYAIQGNFHNLQRYTPLLHSPERAHRRRVLCMFGNTFANLQNEIMFVRNSLVGFSPGDFLLLNVSEAVDSSSDPAKLLAQDRRLTGKFSSDGKSSERQMFFDPYLLHRHIPGVKRVDLSPTLGFEACPVPGSYAADIRATAYLTNGETRQFSMLYVKRYNRDQLDTKMRNEGWNALANWRYGDESQPRLLLLYQRMRLPEHDQ